MIWESGPWRAELGRIADRLEAWQVEFDIEDDQVAFEQERDAFLSAFMLRKLIEAHKLPDSLVASPIHLDAYPLLNDRVPDHLNWDRVDEFYDWDHPERRTLTLEQVCNQFIHSFICMVETSYDEDDPPGTPVGLRGFFVASDRTRSSVLYRLGLASYTEVLQRAAHDGVVATRMSRAKDGQWLIVNSSTEDMGNDHPPG